MSLLTTTVCLSVWTSQALLSPGSTAATRSIVASPTIREAVARVLAASSSGLSDDDSGGAIPSLTETGVWRDLFRDAETPWLHDAASKSNSADTFHELSREVADLLDETQTLLLVPESVLSGTNDAVRLASETPDEFDRRSENGLPDDSIWLSELDLDAMTTGLPLDAAPRSRRQHRLASAFVQVGRLVRTEIREPGQGSGVLSPNHRSRIVQPRADGPIWEVATGVTWKEFLQGDSYARRFRDTSLGFRWDLSRATQVHLVWTRSFLEETDDGLPANRGVKLQTQWEF